MKRHNDQIWLLGGAKSIKHLFSLKNQNPYPSFVLYFFQLKKQNKNNIKKSYIRCWEDITYFTSEIFESIVVNCHTPALLEISTSKMQYNTGYSNSTKQGPDGEHGFIWDLCFLRSASSGMDISVLVEEASINFLVWDLAEKPVKRKASALCSKFSKICSASWMGWSNQKLIGQIFDRIQWSGQTVASVLKTVFEAVRQTLHIYCMQKGLRVDLSNGDYGRSISNGLVA